MNPDRWKQINEVFHAVLDLPSPEREAYLDEVCATDADLRSEVSSLLVAHAASSVFDRPAYESASALLGEDVPDPLLGNQLGPYRVVSTLGRGGMGVVYLGQDTRLQRPVAIKALPSEFTGDDRFRARLRQEAMTTAALSHPGIATVYALEEIDLHLYLVSEYVAGETLREMLADGPLPLEMLLDVAVDVAAALAAAHAGGVIHRDLKPENVMRTPAAVVKVLDFGLARFEAVASAGVDGDAVAEARLTRAGAAIGTPGYMSPEQLRGGCRLQNRPLFLRCGALRARHRPAPFRRGRPDVDNGSRTERGAPGSRRAAVRLSTGVGIRHLSLSGEGRL